VSAAYPLPDVRKVQDILGTLFEGLDVKAGGTFDQTANGGAWFGVFMNEAGTAVALCGADVSLAAGLSAALSMLPPTAAAEAIHSREFSSGMFDNLREVINICTRLVVDSASPHLKLDQLYKVAALPVAAAAILAKPMGRREFSLKVPRYGGGVLSLLAI